MDRRPESGRRQSLCWCTHHVHGLRSTQKMPQRTCGGRRSRCSVVRCQQRQTQRLSRVALRIVWVNPGAHRPVRAVRIRSVAHQCWARMPGAPSRRHAAITNGTDPRRSGWLSPTGAPPRTPSFHRRGECAYERVHPALGPPPATWRRRLGRDARCWCGGLRRVPGGRPRGGCPAATSYTFTTLNDQADPTFNQLLGINSHNVIAGYFGSGTAGHPNKGYLLNPPYSQANYVNENFPSSQQTQVTGLNNKGDTAGFWVNTAGTNRGFVEWNGSFTSYTNPLTPHVPGSVN